MDLNKKVTVLLPNGRRQNLKINPNTTLLQILEDACQKHGFASDEYGLKSHNKELDLSQMFRFTGLPNNCVVEMFECSKKRLESIAEICVQLEDGSRRTGEFAPNSTLKDVLIELCPEYLELGISPVFVYMRKEIFGDQLDVTNLKSLGITGGRTMIRLVNKNPEEMKTQAGVYIAPTVKEDTKIADQDISQPSQKQPKKEFTITSEMVQLLRNNKSPLETSSEEQVNSSLKSAESETEVSKPPVVYDWGTGTGRTIKSTTSLDVEDDSQSESMEVEPTVNVIGSRDAVLYSMDCAQKQMDDLPDSFYDLTVNDLKLVLRDLKRVAEGEENTPLLTAKLRELEESKAILRKMAMYKNCVIRVQFPDRYVLQGIFKPTDKIEDVISFVRGFITNPDLDFHLFTIPPKNLMPNDKTLLELDCIPTAVLHFGVDEDVEAPSPMLSYVKEEFLSNLTTPEGAYFLATKSRSMHSKFEENKNENREEENEMQTNREYSAPGPSTGAIPKRPRSDQPRSTIDDRKSSDIPKWFKQPHK